MPVAQRAARQNQRPKKQAIGFDNPLDVGDRAAKTRLQSWQSHVHNRAVNECHAGPKDRYSQNPGFCVCRAGSGGMPRIDYGFVTWCLHERVPSLGRETNSVGATSQPSSGSVATLKSGGMRVPKHPRMRTQLSEK